VVSVSLTYPPQFESTNADSSETVLLTLITTVRDSGGYFRLILDHNWIKVVSNFEVSQTLKIYRMRASEVLGVATHSELL